MARAAGNKSYYTLRLERKDGEIDPDLEIRLPSVTHIIHAALAAPELVGWAYRQTVESVDILLTSWLEGGITRDELIDALQNEDLDQHLANNRLRPDDVKDLRADEGTRAHEYLSQLAMLRRPDPTTPYEKAIESWWFQKAGFTWGAQPEASETFMYSLKNGYAGTSDLLFWDTNGKLILMDLKTRAAQFWGGTPRTEAYFSDHLQCRAYAGAWEEMTGMPVSGTGVLLALDNGGYIWDTNMVEWKVWEALKTLYDGLPERSRR